jgi:hypothetical protein
VNGAIRVGALAQHYETLTDEYITECLPQRGIITYGLAQNRLNPLAGILKAAIFNTSRRASSQVLHWGVPLLAAYSAMNWAIEK